MTPAASEPAPGEPDIFVSYAREDIEFVRRLDDGLTARGKVVWVDYGGIRKTEEWWPRVCRGIEASKTFAAVISPDFVTSDVCSRELRHAVEQNKRLIPLARRTVPDDDVPRALGAFDWINFREADDADEALGTLIEALDTDFAWLEAHARLLVRATEWRMRGDDKSVLLRGKDLVEAQNWLAAQGSHKERATPLQGEYIRASREAAIRRRNQLLGAVAIAAAVAIVLAVVAYVQRNDAVRRGKIAQSRQLAEASLLKLSVDPQQGLRLAIQAADVRQTAQAAQSLREAILASHAVAQFRSPAPVDGAAIDPTGTLVATADSAGDVRLWPAEGGRATTVTATLPASERGVAFSPDGRRLLVAGLDGEVRIWRVGRRGEPVLLRAPGEANITHAVFSPDGRFVLTTSDGSGAARIWTAGGVLVGPLSGPSSAQVTAAAYSPDGTHVVIAESNGTARVWPAPRGGRPVVLNAGGQSPINAVAFGRGGIVVTGGGDGVVRLFHAAGGPGVVLLHSGPTAVDSVAVSGDGRLAAAGLDNGTARVWNLRSHGSVYLIGHTGAVTRIAFSRDGKLVLTASSDTTARLWDSTTGAQVAVLRGHAGEIADASFSRDGKFVVTASTDHTAIVWRTADTQDVATVRTPRGVQSVAFGAKGRVLAVGGTDGAVRLWRAASGRVVRLPCSGRGSVASVAFVGARLVLAAGTDGYTRLCPVDGGGPRVLGRAGARSLERAVVSPDGRLAAAVGDEPELRIWRLPAATPVRVPAATGLLHDAAFNGDGTLLATAGDDGAVRLWTVGGGKPRTLYRTAHGAAIRAVAFNPDGSVLAAVGDDGVVRLFHIPDGKPAGSRPLAPGLVSVAFSPDGSHLVVGAYGGKAWVWRPPDGAPVRLADHFNELVAARFSADGRLVLTASIDGTAGLWSATGSEITVLREHVGALTDAVFGGAFGPGGDLLVVTAGRDGAARILACEVCGSTDDLEQRACARLLSAPGLLCKKPD